MVTDVPRTKRLPMPMLTRTDVLGPIDVYGYMYRWLKIGTDVCGSPMLMHTIPCLSKRRERSSLIDFFDQNPSLARSHLDFFESFLIFIRPSNRPANKSSWNPVLACAIPQEDLRLSRRRAAPCTIVTSAR